MLQFITGTTGTGKTTLLRRLVCEAVNDGKKAIVIVPEQYSFETEKSLYNAIGAQKAIAVEVLSFTRLCNRIFREYGGLAGEYITDASRVLLMSVALEEMRDMLQLYSGKNTRLSFIQTLVSQVSELKNAGVTPEALESFSLTADESLAAKTAELAAIYRHYQALIDCSYKDAEDDFKSACAQLECNNFFGEYSVFIDSFKSFTAGEHQILGHILAQALEVTVALCTDSLQDKEHGMGLFSLVKKTAASLCRIAEENGAEAVVLKNLTENRRTALPDLLYLEKNIFRTGIKPYTKSCDNIFIVKAQNKYDEVEYAAASICEAVRAGVRYREIAVVGHDIDGYRQAFSGVFERFGIPFFMDVREDIAERPLTAAVLCALGAICKNFNTDEILSLLKTGLLGPAAYETGEIENYCFTWRINGESWLAPFVQSPAGYGKIQVSDKKALERINILRQRVTEPLLKMREALQNCDGAGFARAVFAYLNDAGIIEYLKKADDNDEIAADCEKLYEKVLSLLTEFSVALRGVYLKPEQFTELLRLVFSSADVGEIPQTLDRVTIGSADRIRLAAPKLTFLVGANEGVFPAVYKSGGVFSGYEREALISGGLELTATAESKAIDEIYCAYMAMCSPSQKLFVSYSCAGLKGEALYPSSIVREIRTVFPFVTSISAENCEDIFYIQNKKTALDIFCKNLRFDNEFTASLAEYLSKEDGGAQVNRLLNPKAPMEYRLDSPEVIKGLYGEVLKLSPSKLEQFYQCRLAYFCRYGLAIKPRRRAELSPLESGSIVHYVLQILLLRHNDLTQLAADEAALRCEIQALLKEYTETNMGGEKNKPARFKYLFTRLQNTLVKLIQHMAKEFSESDFRPIYFELPIKKEEKNYSLDNLSQETLELQALRVEPVELPYSGGKVFVEGVVDRVDIMKRGGRHYLRVVDYKTGDKKFDLTDVYGGLNLQMLIYLFTLKNNGKNELAGAVPAGVLYMPARTKYSTLERESSDAQVAEDQDKNMKMNGLLLESVDVITGMEHGAQGVYIPAYIKTKEKTTGRAANKKTECVTEICGDVATLAELGRLEAHINRLVSGMAESLHDGEAGALPTYTKRYDKTCEYCDYRPVCTREDDEPKKELEQMSRDEIFALIAKNEEEDNEAEAKNDAND
ncbi:MAG: PD-(D/E)XK nuclease family protein [Hydrogenoanaerobacterium sp.]